MRFPPNITVLSNEKLYRTDDYGRPATRSLAEPITEPPKSNDRSQAEQIAVGGRSRNNGGPPDDFDGGHAFAKQLGGAMEQINYFAQKRAENQGHYPARPNSWYLTEGDIANSVKKIGASIVGWDVIENHPGSSPASFSHTPDTVTLRITLQFPIKDANGNIIGMHPPVTEVRIFQNM
jgi:hypothetical protein